MVRDFFLRTLCRLTMIMLIPVILLGGFAYTYMSGQVRAQIDRNQEIAVGHSGTVCGLLLQTFDTVELLVSSNYQVASALKSYSGERAVRMSDVQTLNQLHHTVLSILAACPYLDSVDILIDGLDHFYSSNMKVSALAGNTDGEWLQSLARDALPSVFLRTLPPRLSADSERQMLCLVRPAFTGTKSLSGLVLVQADLNRVRNYLKSMHQDPHQDVYLVSPGETVSLMGTQPYCRDIVEDMVQSGEYVKESTWNGVLSRISVNRMERYDWYHVAVTPLDQLYAAQHTAIRLLAGIVMLCILLSLVLSWMMSRRTAANVHNVVEAVSQAAGRSENELPSERHVDDIYGYIVREIEKTGLYRQMMEMQVRQKHYELQLHEARELQYQINPHFQINTLKTIYWKIVEKEGMQSEAACMVENMLDFTGYVLADPHTLVSLAEEIEHTRSFCEILQVRHAGDVDITWDIEDACLQAMCCRLILQPYIENAYYHGLRGLESHRSIEVYGRVENGLVVIRIRDDGRGMERERLEEIRHCLTQTDVQQEFTGIYNPHRRIVLTFGSEYGASIESEPDRGTEITLRFPYVGSADTVQVPD